MPDPILEEIRLIRDTLAEQFHFDMHALCEDLRRDPIEGTREVVIPPETRHEASLSVGETRKLNTAVSSSAD